MFLLLIAAFVGYQQSCHAFTVLQSKSWNVFIFLFLFRYIRLVVNLVAYWFYNPYVPSNSPLYKAKDVTVIVPTADPTGFYFKECVLSILNSSPALLIIVAAGKGKNGKSNYEQLCQEWATTPGLKLIECKVMDKRRQVATAVPIVSQNPRR